jgi:hypothetical protein
MPWHDISYYCLIHKRKVLLMARCIIVNVKNPDTAVGRAAFCFKPLAFDLVSQTALLQAAGGARL